MEVEFPGVIKQKSCGISMDTGSQFCETLRSEASFLRNF